MTAAAMTIAEMLDAEPREPVPCAARLLPAVADGHLCAESCSHLRRNYDGDPQCEAFDSEPLHPSFEAEPIATTPRAERCAACLIAEELFDVR